MDRAQRSFLEEIFPVECFSFSVSLVRHCAVAAGDGGRGKRVGRELRGVMVALKKTTVESRPFSRVGPSGGRETF